METGVARERRSVQDAACFAVTITCCVNGRLKVRAIGQFAVGLPSQQPRASVRASVVRFLVVTESRNRARSQLLLAKDQQQQPQALPNADHAKAA
jgi:hypothetical protein